MADEKKTYLVNVESNLNKYAQDAAKASEEVDRLALENFKLKNSTTATKEEVEKNSAALRNAKKDYNEAKKLVDLQTQANNSNINSRKQLNAILTLEQRRLGSLANTYTVNSKGVRELSQDYINQVKRLKEAKDAVISYDKAQGDGRSSVGLYSEAIQGSLGGLEAMPGALGQAVGGVTRLTTAAKAFIATPIGLIIAAIVAVIGLLTKAFKNSQPLMDAFHKVSAAIGATFKVLLDRVSNFTEFLGSIFNKELRASREEARLLNDELIGIDETMTRQEKRRIRRESRKGIIEEIREETKAAYGLEKAEQALEDREIAFIQRKAEMTRQVEELFSSTKDENLSDKERIENLDKAIALTKEMTGIEVEFAKERARISKERTEQGNSTREELRANEEAQATAAEAEAKGFKEIKRLGSERFSLIKRINQEETALAKERTARAEKEAKESQDILDKHIEAVKKDAEARRKEREKAGVAEFARLQKEYEARIELEKQRELTNQENIKAIREQTATYEFNLRRTVLDEELAMEIEAAEKIGADVNLINEKYANARQQLDDEEIEGKLGLYADFAGNLAQIFGENTAIGKAAAIAETTINTYAAAMAAYKSLAGVPVVGPALGIAAAAAAVAAGIANVKKIVAVKSGLPGDKAISAPTAITNTIVRTAAPQANIFTRPQLTQQQLNAVPNQNILTAEDIANAVSRLPAPKVSVEDINARIAEKQKIDVRATI